MTASFTESVIEQAALAWLEAVGWPVRNGAEIAPGKPAVERDDYGEMVVAQLLRDARLRKLISGKLRLHDAEPYVANRV